MPVDDGLVDPDTVGDAIDPDVLRPAVLVKQGAGGVDDLSLARAADGGAGLSARGHP